MFKEEFTNLDNNFITDNEYILTFYPKKDNKYINVDFGSHSKTSIYTDKIEILKNCGIGFYLNGILVKFIEACNILAVYKKDLKCFKIIYSNTIELLEDKNLNFEHDSILIRYTDNFEFGKDNNRDIKIGDKVIPSIFYIPYKNNDTITFSLFILNLYAKITCDEINDKEINKLLDEVIHYFGYTVEKLIYKAEDLYCFIKMDNEVYNILANNKNIDRQKIIKSSYIKSSNLITKKILLKNISIFKNEGKF